MSKKTIAYVMEGDEHTGWDMRVEFTGDEYVATVGRRVVLTAREVYELEQAEEALRDARSRRAAIVEGLWERGGDGMKSLLFGEWPKPGED